MIWVGISRLAKYWHQMAEAKTSMPASLSGLPCSAVSTGARSAVDAINTSAACSSVARRAASSAFQSRAALAAASKAAPTADPTILPPAPLPLNGAGSTSPEEPRNEGVHRVTDPHPQRTVLGCGGNEGGRLVEETQEQRGGDLRITGH